MQVIPQRKTTGSLSLFCHYQTNATQTQRENCLFLLVLFSLRTWLWELYKCRNFVSVYVDNSDAAGMSLTGALLLLWLFLCASLSSALRVSKWPPLNCSTQVTFCPRICIKWKIEFLTWRASDIHWGENVNEI